LGQEMRASINARVLPGRFYLVNFAGKVE
jgi:hypothetical protein